MLKQLTVSTQNESGSNSTSDVLERIENHLSAAPIVLFMKGTRDFPECDSSAQIVAALRACNADFVDVNVLDDSELREALEAYSQWPTFPQLYIWQELVGGCDIVLDLYGSGELLHMVVASEDDGDRDRRRSVRAN